MHVQINLGDMAKWRDELEFEMIIADRLRKIADLLDAHTIEKVNALLAVDTIAVVD